MTSLAEPVDRTLLRALRAAVLELRAGHRERTFPVQVSVGSPAGARAAFTPDTGADLDLDLRIEIVGALLRRYRASAPDREQAPVAWLARPGEPAWHDRDAEWLPAAVAAYAEAGLDLDFVVLTKQGWYDPRSGVFRRWKRLRAGRGRSVPR